MYECSTHATAGNETQTLDIVKHKITALFTKKLTNAPIPQTLKFNDYRELLCLCLWLRLEIYRTDKNTTPVLTFTVLPPT